MLGHAQTITGSVRGMVTDPTGAVIPNATVTATNVATGVTSSTQTNGAGLYSVRFLQIGNYTISVAAKGFIDERSSPFQLEIDQEATVNVPMSVQGGSAQVTVNFNSAPILNQENPTLGITVDQKTVESLPLNGQSFFATTVAVPGAVHTGGNTNDQPSVNGNREESNSILLDGIDIYNAVNNGGGYNTAGTALLYNVSPYAIQQVRVITTNAGAEFGNVSGGEMILATKGGTNQFHGSAFFQLENYNMDANSWSNKHQVTASLLQPYTKTYFGGTLGGPIAKNKLFFFADYQGFRTHAGGDTATSVAPAAFRNGDLSLLLNPPQDVSSPQQAKQLYDSQNNFAPFVNNQVPVRSSIQQYLNAHPDLYPLPNAAPLDGIAKNNYVGPNNTFSRTNQGDVKIDWAVSPRDALNGRYSVSYSSGGTVTAPLPISFPSAIGQTVYNSFVLNEIHTFSPSIVNNFTVGFARSNAPGTPPTDPSGELGLSGNSIVGINLPQQYAGFTNQSFSNSSVGSFGVSNFYEAFIQNFYQYSDLLSIQHGRHLLKMGGQFERIQQNYVYGGNSQLLGSFGYTGDFTSKYNSSGLIADTGDGFADYLLDYVSSKQVENNPGGLFGERQWRDGVFFQDDWKVSSNLTLNLGMRWEYFQPQYEVNNKQTNIDLATGAILQAGVNGASRALYNPTYTGFEPRIGFAYAAMPKLVFSGGYGISASQEGLGANQRLTQNPPFTTAYNLQIVAPTATSSGTPYQVGAPFTGEVAAAATSYRAWDKNTRPEMTQEFNLAVQYQLDNYSSLQVGYVGETGQHLFTLLSANQLSAPGAAAPYANSLGQNISILRTHSGAMMNYNALQVIYRVHEHQGLDFTANYTFSKSLSNADGGYNGISGNLLSPIPQNSYDLHAEYGPSPMDARHSVSGTLTYDLPFGRGKRFGTDINRYADLALGGWKLSSVVQAFTGQPLTISSNANYSSNLNTLTGAYANHVGPLHINNRSLQHWFGTDPSALPCQIAPSGTDCAYSPESGTAFGTARPGSEYGPGFEDIDLSASKSFHIIGAHELTFRADAFNALNMVSYGNPDTNVSDGVGFGEISSARSTSRILQLNLVYKF
jgi:hypothetical protein